jgi:hypothetical protein
MRKVIIGLAIFFAAAVAAVAQLATLRQSSPPQPPEPFPAASTALSPSLPSPCSPAPSSTEPSVVAADAAILLPLIPPPPAIPHGPTGGILGPLPGEVTQPPNPDEDKNLYGYSGPYYNTASLDGRVIVLDKTTHVWSTSTWKVSGLIRNQTRCTIHVVGLTGRLLGVAGKLLDTVTTSVPVSDLRPGEPGPFLIEAPQVATSAVKSVIWQLDYLLAESASRLFELNVYKGERSGSSYYLDGLIHNAATTTARGVRVVAAWFDLGEKGAVLHVSSVKLRRLSNPKMDLDAIDLKGGESEEFIFIAEGPELVQLLGNTRYALWGISQ